MKLNTIIYEKRDAFAYITFNRPKALNAINREMLDDLARITDDLRRDEGIRAIIVTGAGKAFIAGADIAAMRDFTAAEGREFNLYVQQQINNLENLPVPVICAINGYALGGGLELALACDIRIIAQDAKIGLPEVALGIFPGGGGTQRLPRLINNGYAKYYIYTGEHIPAQRAYELGIVQEVTGSGDLTGRAQEIADKIAKQGPIAVRMAKRVINEGANLGLRPSIVFDSEAYATTFATEDRITGMTAFLNKTKANFQNR